MTCVQRIVLYLIPLAVLLGRVLEDYAVIYCGSAVFKISRLLLIAMMCDAPTLHSHDSNDGARGHRGCN
jgi:hypothetical protein